MPKMLTIKHNRIFREVARKGDIAAKNALTVKFIRRRDTSHAYYFMGFVTSRKVGNAVVRNLVKRRLKAISREYIKTTDFPSNYYYMIISKPLAATMTFAQLKADLHSAFGAIRHRVRQHGQRRG